MKGYLVMYMSIDKSFQKAFGAIERNLDLERNNICHLENSIMIYCVHNPETMEKIVTTIQKMLKNHMELKVNFC